MISRFWHLNVPRVQPRAKNAPGMKSEHIVCSTHDGHKRGGKRIGELSVIVHPLGLRDFTWTWLSDALISPRVLDLFEKHHVTGFEARPAAVSYPKGIKAAAPAMFELVVFASIRRVPMTIEQPNVVDIAATDPKTNTVLPVISDHLKWTGDDQEDKYHMYLLQEKINLYVAAIDTGEIYKKYPNAIGKSFIIRIAAKFPMTLEADEFLNKVQSFLSNFGYRLEFDGPRA